MVLIFLAALLCVEPTPTPTAGVVYEGVNWCPTPTPTPTWGYRRIWVVPEPTPTPTPAPTEELTRCDDWASKVAITFSDSKYLYWMAEAAWPDSDGTWCKTDIRKVVEAHCGGCPSLYYLDRLSDPERDGVSTTYSDIVWCVEAESRYTYDGHKTRPWFACYDSQGHEVFRSIKGDGWIPIGGGS